MNAYARNAILKQTAKLNDPYIWHDEKKEPFAVHSKQSEFLFS